MASSDDKTQLRLIACPHLLSIEKDRIDRMVPSGGTIVDHLREIGWTRDRISVRVMIDGVLVKDAAWEHTIPQAGQSLVVRAIPMGGAGGDSQGKDAMRIGLMVAVIAASIFTAGAAGAIVGGFIGVSAAAGSAIVGAAVSIVGTLAIQALIPPARPKLNDLSGLSNSSNTLSLNGTSNQLIPYGVVPRVYGRHRIFPPLAARHYTEVVGDTQFLRAVFCLGHGPLALSNFRIGETPIELFTGVQMEVRQGYASDPEHTLYPAPVSEEPLAVNISSVGGPKIRATKDGTTEISVDFTFAGLWADHLDGPQPHSIALLVEYRRQGDTAWIIANDNPFVPAGLTTALAGTDNDLTFNQVGIGGVVGNNMTITYVDLGERPSETLSVTPAGPNAFAFTVGLRKVAGIYSTASQIKAFLEASTFLWNEPIAFPYGQYIEHIDPVTHWITITLAPGNDGSGPVVPMAPAHLAGGLNGTNILSVTDTRLTNFKKDLSWHTPAPGIYEVQVTKITADVADPAIHDTVFWTALRSIRSGVHIVPAGMCSVAIRIKATDQLNGTLDAFNCIAESILPDWDAASNRWVDRITNNPASIFRDIHQGTANARPKLDSRMDLTTIQAFHVRCAAHGFHFNAIIDFRSTVAELSRDVLAAGRATPGYRDGKVSVVEDIPQTTPVHVLTPRNSWGFKGTKVFVDLPHALRVRFANADTLQQDERVVLSDDYGYTGTDGIRRDAFGLPTTLPEATVFEAVEAGVGVNEPDQIFKLQRYNLAVLALRPETYSLSCDFEQLVMLRGDLIMVQHDVPLFGLISGRITALTVDAIGRVTTVSLDEPCVMDAGERYGLRVRLQDGTQVQREVQTVVGAQSTLTFLEPV